MKKYEHGLLTLEKQLRKHGGRERGADAISLGGSGMGRGISEWRRGMDGRAMRLKIGCRYGHNRWSIDDISRFNRRKIKH